MLTRMPRLALLLLPCLALLGALRPAPAAAREDALPTPERIDAAIDRGVAWLLAEAKPGGHYGDVGKTALAAFTLQHAGLAETQPGRDAARLAKALRWLDRFGHARKARRDPKAQTYDLSLQLMLLRLRGRVEDRARMQRLADQLVGRQAHNGQWWYDGRGLPHIDVGDNSNTQFALLALGHAQAAGLDVPAACWRRARAWWTQSPGAKGGFGYASGGSAKSAATGSMTAAGIASLALCDAALTEPAGHEAALRARAVQQRAMRFLAEVFSVTRNHGPTPKAKRQKQRNAGRGWLHYYLWSVERAMVLAGHERLGTLDWYAAGAARLLATQQKDGSWRQEMPLYATCFALLFLTRAADPPRVFTPHAGDRRRPAAGGPVTGAAPAGEAEAGEGPGGADPAVPLPEGTVTDWLAVPLPVGELARRCRRVGASCLAPLVAALDHKDKARRARAWEALVALLPEARIARADRHRLARGRLALWVRLHAPDLVLLDGRFVEP